MQHSRMLHTLPFQEEGGVASFFGEHPVLHQAQVDHPCFELGRGSQLEELAQRRRVVEGGALVRKHRVVPIGTPMK